MHSAPLRASLCLTLLLIAGNALAQAGQAVSALGRLEPGNGVIKVTAPSTPQALLGGLLVELHVEEGDDVRQGDLLAVTDTAVVMEATVREAEAGVLFAERGVEAARSNAVEACVRADVAADEAERRARLREQGVAGEEEAESARGEAEARKAACASASTAVRLSETGVEVARAHLARVEAERQRSYVRAPVDGRVIDIMVWPGELIGEAGILELAQVDRMKAIAEIYETDIRRVKTGQRATINSAALENELTGTVESIRHKVQKQDEIGTDPAARKDARIVEVTIALDDSGPAAGLTNLQVDVVIQP
jgi:HlyD family secretion protein